MARRAVLPGAVAAGLAFLVAFLVGGGDAGWSAGIGIAVVLANFTAHAYSLAWASTVSITAVQVVALAGFAVRLGVIVGLLFLLNTMSWFSPLAFGLTVVPATLALLVYEAHLVVNRRLGTDLDLPPDSAAARAHERLAAKEGSR
jgi:ATP synthase protein I